MLTSDKHSNLLGQFLSYNENDVNTHPGAYLSEAPFTPW